MAPIIAPGITRFSVNASYAEHEVVNILDMHMDGLPLGDDRADSNFNQAGIIINQWVADIMPHLSNRYVCRSVSWLDLDSEDGSTGERSSTDTVTLPTNGNGSWEAMPGNVALRVNKNITAKRGQRQGRMFLAGFSEAGTNQAQPNMPTSSTVTSINDSLESFLGNLNQETSQVPGSQEYDSTLVVVHTKLGVFTDTSDVQSLTCDPYLSSQVKRIRR